MVQGDLAMIFQKLLKGQDDLLYFLTTTGLYIRDTESTAFKAVWQLPADAKISLLPVGVIGKRFALLADSLKQVFLVNLADGIVAKEYRSEKCPTAMVIENEEDGMVTVLVADRFGDVSRVTFALQGEVEVKVVVGHVSIITDLGISSEKDALMTVDRDEKIRISSLKNPHLIRSFLLGHTEYVSAATIIKNRVVSISGDGTARLWNLDAEGSSNAENQLDVFKFDQEVYGRRVKSERVVSKKEEDDKVEEEVEEVEQSIVEPFAMTVLPSGEIDVIFDNSNIVCFLRIDEDKLVHFKDHSVQEGHAIVSICSASSSLQILSLKEGTFYLSTLNSEPISIGSSDSASNIIDGLWKGGMRKDCHGLFAKRVKNKRARDDGEAAELSDIDD